MSPAFDNLCLHQGQLDADGTMVAVSRQALDETLREHLALIEALGKIQKLADEYLSSIPADLIKGSMLGERFVAIAALARVGEGK